MSVFVRPAANLAVKQELYSIAQSRAGSLLKEKVFNDVFPDVLIYVDRIVPPGNTFQGVLIVDQRDRNAENIIIGRVALLLSDPGSIGLRLYDGTVHERGKKRAGFSRTSFNVYNLHLELDPLLTPLAPGRRSPEDMSLPRLRDAIRSKAAQGADTIREIMELHRRFAFPFAPLVFALLGIAIVLTPNRRPAGRSHGVASCLAWLFAYYALLSTGTAMAETGRIPPALGPWLPNLLVGLVSIYLFVRALKESPSTLPTLGAGPAPVPGPETHAGARGAGEMIHSMGRFPSPPLGSILDRYLLALFSRIFVATLAVVVLLHLAGDVFNRVDNLMGSKTRRCRPPFNTSSIGCPS